MPHTGTTRDETSRAPARNAGGRVPPPPNAPPRHGVAHSRSEGAGRAPEDLTEAEAESSAGAPADPRLPAEADDPLSGGHLASCRPGDPGFGPAMSPQARQTPVEVGPGLRGVLRTSPASPCPLLGVHNPTDTAREFTVTRFFPDVAAGRARLVFVGGDVETLPGSPDGPPTSRLLPGGHVWLSQTTGTGRPHTPPRAPDEDGADS
ncbi:hypothetical protein [Thermomonospora umbrina]|uniref:Uncharacterized protein n=1 Tax=Thermomonospora umbrina TaxID=111806 RepID=A0A3D9SVG8_9ACTN|nr:hypothetical protein [Thermomonospora umbrina]REE99926.1 hypothetical protein DFJ69_5444 [Thermomonospora umbrina]